MSLSKKELAQLSDKLNRLHILGKSNNYQFETLNSYSNFINSIISKHALTITSIAILGKGDSAYLGGVPSTTEVKTMNELISKYSEILIEHTPKSLKIFFSGNKIFNFLTVAAIIGLIGLFYNIGKDTNNGMIEILTNENKLLTDTINRLKNTLNIIGKDASIHKDTVFENSPKTILEGNLHHAISSSDKQIVSGNSNHIVTGNGNNVGVNGDVNINQEKHLPKEYANRILATIKQLQIDSNISSKRIDVGILAGSNGGTYFLDELKNYLKNNGYDVRETPIFHDLIKGVHIHKSAIGNYVEIAIGTLDF